MHFVENESEICVDKNGLMEYAQQLTWIDLMFTGVKFEHNLGWKTDSNGQQLGITMTTNLKYSTNKFE